MAKTRVDIAKAGEYWGHWQGGYELTADDLQRMAANFTMEVVIDYEHNSLNPEAAMAPAAGWVQRLEVEGNLLWGEVSWTDRAEEMIDTGEYRHLSPVIDMWALDPETANPIGAKLISVGLTNTPFMEELEGVQNAAKGDLICRPVPRGLVLNHLRHQPSNKPNEPMTQPDTETKFRAFLNRIAGIFGTPGADELGVLDEARQAVQNSQRVADLETTNTEQAGEIAALKATIAQHEAQVQEQQASADQAFINSAIADGKIAKAEETDWLGRLTANREGTKALLNSIKPGMVSPENRVEQPTTDPRAEMPTINGKIDRAKIRQNAKAAFKTNTQAGS